MFDTHSKIFIIHIEMERLFSLFLSLYLKSITGPKEGNILIKHSLNESYHQFLHEYTLVP